MCDVREGYVRVDLHTLALALLILHAHVRILQPDADIMIVGRAGRANATVYSR